MSPSHAGHVARFGAFRHRIRPILSTAAQVRPRRAVVAVPVHRTEGVGAPSGGGLGTAVGPELPPVEAAVAMALQTLDLLQRRAAEVAEGFRWHHVEEANTGLGELVQSTQMLLRLAMATANATGADLAALCAADGVRVDEETRAAVDQLISRQFAEDWLGVADTIDENFAPALAQWRVVFEALGEPPDDPGGRAA
jgi:hypothetical protein